MPGSQKLHEVAIVSQFVSQLFEGGTMGFTAEQHRQRRTMQKYGRNAANKFVRTAAFRECDYTEAGELHEFVTEADVLAFETARYEDGTGYKVKFWNRPRATVAAEQLALEATVVHAVADDGNETRVQLSMVEEGIHTRMDAIVAAMASTPAHCSEPPKGQAGDLELMARLQKMCKVRRMNSLLKEHDIHYEVGLKVADKAALLVQKLPRDRLLEILANPQLTATPKSAPSSSRSSASASVSVARACKKRSAPTSGARNMSLTELLPAADHGGALAAPSDAHSQQADSQAEPHEAHDSELEEAEDDLDAQEVLKEEADAAEAAENEAILDMDLEEMDTAYDHERAAPNAKSVSRSAADSEDDVAVPPRKKCRVKECRMGLPTQAGIDAIFNVTSRSAHLTPAPSDALVSSQQAPCTF